MATGTFRSTVYNYEPGSDDRDNRKDNHEHSKNHLYRD
jgi:hypothetical protein